MSDLITLYANAKRRIAELERENAAVRMQQAAVRQRIYNKGYRREYITHEKRAHLLRRRGVKL